MSQRNSLVQIIRSLENHRHILGDDVVDLSVAALKQKGAADFSLLLPTNPQAYHTQTAVVLVADLADYTALSARLDAEEVHDAMNQIWRWLDQIIQRWGGRIEQHRGDGLVAVFGLTDDKEDAPQRAVWAALAMQTELSLFQRQTQLLPRHALQMRIGLDLGDVTIGPIGSDQTYMAAGEAVRIAERLEQLAPVGNILISHDLYQLLGTEFEVEPFILPEAEQERAAATYLVLSDKPPAFWQHLRLNETIPHLIGRENEHEQLQQFLTQVVGQQQAHMVTLLGNMGMGKSHLLYHFEQWLNLAPVSALLLRGRIHPDWLQWPIPPLGNVLADLLGLRLYDSQHVLVHKIHSGLKNYLPAEQLPEAIAIVESWLGLSSDKKAANNLAQWLMLLVQLLQRVLGQSELGQSELGQSELGQSELGQSPAARNRPVQVVVLLLEDLHRADESVLNFIEALFRQCDHLPLLLLASGRPSLRAKRPSWPTAVRNERHTWLKLSPLSTIDSHHLVTAFVPHLTATPLSLYNFLVAGARGIPLYIREAIRLLQIQGNLPTVGETTWSPPHLSPTRQENSRLNYQNGPSLLQPPEPLSLLWQQQLAALKAEELAVLQRAAIVGYRFWDTAVLHLSVPPLNGSSQPTPDLIPILENLSTVGLIRRQPFSIYNGARAYSFNHPGLHRLLYEQIPAQEQQAYRRQIAAWQQQQVNRLGAVQLSGLAQTVTDSLTKPSVNQEAISRESARES